MKGTSTTYTTHYPLPFFSLQSDTRLKIDLRNATETIWSNRNCDECTFHIRMHVGSTSFSHTHVNNPLGIFASHPVNEQIFIEFLNSCFEQSFVRLKFDIKN